MMHETSPPIFTRCVKPTAGRRWCRTLLAGAVSLAVLPDLAVAQRPAGSASSGTTEPAGSGPSSLPAPPASAAPKDDGQWPMAAKNYAATRFSSLDQINASTVKNLQVAFTFSLGVVKGEEAAPLVVNNTMYIVTAYPNNLFALDLTKPGAPLKWEYQPFPEPASQGEACCDVVNRGAAFDNGRLFFNTLDGNTIAVDAASGKEIWKTQVAHINDGETMTMAPLVVRGKVLVGNSGGEMGVRGWVKALDAGSGKVLWTANATGPDKDVLIGADFHPFYASDQGQDLGVKTWPAGAWQTGGGTMWGWIAYDPDLNLIYYGNANPGPWNQEQRPGDNKWTTAVFARDPDTGMAKWAYQTNPHDQHDYDGINEIILLDMNFDGKSRKVLLHPDRNGRLYVIDRTNGEVLQANPYAYINSTTGVDLKTGRPTINPEKATKLGSVVRDICPTASGGKDWNPSAYSPVTGYLYIPHENLCMDWEDVQTNYIAGTPYVGANVIMKAGPGGNRGEFTAWDVANGKPAWQIKEDLPLWSGALATAGDLVFYGTMDGWFKAVDAHSGALKWQFKTGSGIVGQPIAYRGSDGQEYVAVLSGVGGWAGAIVSGNLDPRDPTGALGFVGAVPDLKKKTVAGGTLYVFALPHA
jgi:PQQ-dependent dehydrogenase (methanol/ethanol family)